MSPLFWIIIAFFVFAFLIAPFIFSFQSPGPRPTIPPLGPPPPPAEVQALNDALADLGDQFGLAMENNRDVGPLIERLDQIIADYPDAAPAYTLKGQMLMFAGRLTETVDAFEHSLQIDPDQANIHQLVGSAQMKLGHLEAAVEHYKKALELEPDQTNHAIFLANAQFKLEQYDDAIQTLEQAIRHDSQLHSAYALLSDIYAKQGKTGLALDQIDRAIEAMPADKARLNIAYILKRAALLRHDNQPAESLALLNRLPAEAQLSPAVLQAVAETWDMLGKPAMAADRYQRVLAADPTNDHAAAEAAKWNLKAGNKEAARQDVKTLQRINPRHPSLPVLLQALQDN